MPKTLAANQKNKTKKQLLWEQKDQQLTDYLR